MKLAIVIPARDEYEYLLQVLKGIEKFYEETYVRLHNITIKVIIVDDCSHSSLKEWIGIHLDSLILNYIVVLRHTRNCGVGTALKTGFKYALKDKRVEWILTMDSDGQHDPEYIESFLELRNLCDITVGMRSFDEKMPLVLRIGNNFISWWDRHIHGIRMHDTQCGYRLYNRKAIETILPKITIDDYGALTQILIIAKKAGFALGQIPIKTVYHYSNKGTNFYQGIKIVVKNVWERV